MTTGSALFRLFEMLSSGPHSALRLITSDSAVFADWHNQIAVEDFYIHFLLLD